ncbi:MAG: hypothetical protein K0U98_11360 [Deltaproteobacteria bacterium]|nr:hypothetical protein [Deltaproteobacteria bacterium]
MANDEALQIYKDFQKDGEAIVLRRVTISEPGGLDPIETHEDHATFGVPTSFESHLVDGQRIQAGDIKILVSSYLLPAEHRPSDQVLRVSNGKLYSVINVGATTERGEDLLYEIHARGEA